MTELENNPRPVVAVLGRRDLPDLLRGLLCGTIGGVVFVLLDTPLPWMIGAMAATAIASATGLPMRMDGRLRNLMIVILGIMLGSAFSPEILARAGKWSISLAAMVLYVGIAGGLAVFIYNRIFGVEVRTSLFSAAPGGFNEMIVLGGAAGADERAISLSHTTRLFLVVMVIPFWFRFLADYSPAARDTTAVGLLQTGRVDLVILAASGLLGYLAARLIRLPAAPLTGPMLASMAVHLIGWTSAPPPAELVAAAQVVIGTAIGCRFAGVTLPEIASTVRNAAVVTLGLAAVAVLFALALAPLMDQAFAPLFLAFTPGGLAEMSLIALALDVDAAFVATHHVARIVIVLLLAPLVYRLLNRRTGPKRRPGR